MLNNIFKDIIKKFKILHNIYIKHKYFIKKSSYSMEGEDLAVLKYIDDIKDGFYVDAGCYHPLHLNNTLLLHNMGWRGINIDISKYSIDLFNHCRPEDVNVNLAVSNKSGHLKYYFQKKISQLTTTRKDISLSRMQGNIKEKQISSDTLSSIIEKSKFENRKIDFLNIDVEGADYEALTSLDFKIYNPKIICIEITENKIEDSKIFKFLVDLNYKKVWSSKTNISHIFIHKNI